MVERLALDEFEDEAGCALMLPELVDRHDVRVRQLRGRGGVTLEQLRKPRTLGFTSGFRQLQGLEGDPPAALRIPGHEHLPHAPGAQRPDHLEMPRHDLTRPQQAPLARTLRGVGGELQRLRKREPRPAGHRSLEFDALTHTDWAL